MLPVRPPSQHHCSCIAPAPFARLVSAPFCLPVGRSGCELIRAFSRRHVANFVTAGGAAHDALPSPVACIFAGGIQLFSAIRRRTRPDQYECTHNSHKGRLSPSLSPSPSLSLPLSLSRSPMATLLINPHALATPSCLQSWPSSGGSWSLASGRRTASDSTSRLSSWCAFPCIFIFYHTHAEPSQYVRAAAQCLLTLRMLPSLFRSSSYSSSPTATSPS